MSRVVSHLQVPIESVEASRIRLVNGLRASGFSIDLLEEFLVEARRGSQVSFRVKGAWMARDEEFPIVVCIRWDSASLASVAVYSEFVGPLTGVRKKYQRVCDVAAILFRHFLGTK